MTHKHHHQVEYPARHPMASWLGLAGVAEGERPKACAVARKFEFPMMLLAFWILFEWYASVRGEIDLGFHYASDWVVWLFFVIETLVLTALVQNKAYYLKTNWMNLLIIVAGVPIVWETAGELVPALRSLRLLLVISLLVPLISSAKEVLARNNLGVTLVVSFIVIFMSGMVISGIDPAIETVWDGLWWAWVTVTTVGYGDIVPSSSTGKIFGALLILMGLGLFSMITASFSAYLYSQEDAEEEEEAEQELQEALERLEKRMVSLEDKLDRVLQDK